MVVIRCIFRMLAALDEVRKGLRVMGCTVSRILPARREKSFLH